MTDDVFEEQLFRLEALLAQLAATVASAADPAEDDADTEIGPVPSHVASTNIDDAAGTVEEALEVCMQMIAVWKFRQVGAAVPAATEVLRRVGRIERMASPPEAAEVVANLPWLLRTALHTLLDDDTIDADPRGRPAIAARMLAAMLGSLEGIESPRQHTEAPTGTRWSTNVIPLTTGPRH